MKIDFDYVFKELDGSDSRELTMEKDDEGNPKRDSEGKPLLCLGDPFTLKKACLNVLTNPPLETDERAGRQREYTAEEKLGMARLARLIFESKGEVAITPEEAVLLKRLLNLRYRNPLTIEQAYKVLA